MRYFARVHVVNNILAKAAKAIVFKPGKVAVRRIVVAHNEVNVAIVVEIGSVDCADNVRGRCRNGEGFGGSQIENFNSVNENGTFCTFGCTGPIFKLDGGQLRVGSKRELVLSKAIVARFHGPRLGTEGVDLRVADDDGQCSTANTNVRADNGWDALRAVKHPTGLATWPDLQGKADRCKAKSAVDTRGQVRRNPNETTAGSRALGGIGNAMVPTVVDATACSWVARATTASSVSV